MYILFVHFAGVHILTRSSARLMAVRSPIARSVLAKSPRNISMDEKNGASLYVTRDYNLLQIGMSERMLLKDLKHADFSINKLSKRITGTAATYHPCKLHCVMRRQNVRVV